MFLPRFSLRTSLLILTVAALFFLVLAKGMGGWAWAFGMAIGVASVFAALAMHACFYMAFTALGRFMGAEEVVARTSQGGTVRASADAAPRLEVPATEDGA
ncbi:MAG: hypothetical protein KDA44_19485 [Planctomycetales bacterium]|nr:hypothetical protein [Planctomycetales bacterium]